MRGHYAYYGISGNIRRLSWYAYQVRRIWQRWLSRRGSRFPWDRYIDLLKRLPLPAPRIVHHRCERSSPVRNRKLEFCTSGSVRGEDGNILTYSAVPQAVEILIWRETNGKHLGEHVTNDSSDAAVAIDHRCSRGAAIDNKPICRPRTFPGALCPQASRWHRIERTALGRNAGNLPGRQAS